MGSSFLRQLSGKKEAWNSSSKRWGNNRHSGSGLSSECLHTSSGFSLSQMEMEGLNLNSLCNGNGAGSRKKRVMVVVDDSSHSKHAMMWALTHVANKGDLLTLLHIIPPTPTKPSSPHSPSLASSLGSLCKACKPEVEVEGLVIQGPRVGTVMSQVKKLDVSVLVLGQKKPSPLLFSCLCGRSSNEEFVEQCINGIECMTIGVRKQSRGMGGYLISTRWQKNFWLLA